jgi:chromosome condensin MukBEF ATPase and DNA-binding subunit MukB
MSLATPQSIAIDGVAADHHRIADNGNSSVYQTVDGTRKFTVSHQQTKTRIRRMVRLDRQIVAADPLTAENQYQSSSVYLVIDEPIVGFTDTILDAEVDAIVAWLSTANIAAVLGSRH